MCRKILWRNLQDLCVRSSLFCNIAHDSGQSIGPIFKDQEVQKRFLLWAESLFKMRPIGYPQTSATTHQSALCKIPEGRRSHLHRDRNLKLGFMCVFCWLSVVGERCIYIRSSSPKMHRTMRLEAFMRSMSKKEILFTFKHEILLLK